MQPTEDGQTEGGQSTRITQSPEVPQGSKAKLYRAGAGTAGMGPVCLRPEATSILPAAVKTGWPLTFCGLEPEKLLQWDVL